MKSVNPAFIIGLVVAILFVVQSKITNPHREFSSKQYWVSATISDVANVPDDALKPGNKNGGVLMWAAMTSQEPKILRELVNRGAEINESDGIFKGTPLTGAARFNQNPEIFEELINLGADINNRVHNKETALTIAARHNKNKDVIKKLVSLGADVNDENSQGKIALEIARANENHEAIDVLLKFPTDKKLTRW